MMFRSRKEREAASIPKQKDSWFRAGGATSTLIVPVTPDGLLAEKVRKNLQKGRQPSDTKTKVVEDGGTSSRGVLVKSNQFPREECGREQCVLCFQKDGGRTECVRCVANNVGYEGKCLRCPTRFSYLGETSRTAYTRLKEHLSDYRAASAARLPALQPNVGVEFGKKKKDVKSWMWEHSRDCHGGVIGEEGGMFDYKFSVTGVFRKCLDRQVDEGLRITECEAEGGTVLNSKNEWYTPKIVEPVFRQQ